MSLNDITPDETFISGGSSIQFLTLEGAAKKVQFGGKNVSETYKWLTAPETETGIAGWYLAKDQDGTELQNRDIPFGDSYCVDAQDADAGMTFSGNVQDEVAKVATGIGFNYFGNCAPAKIKLGDIVPNELCISGGSSIQFLTLEGAAKKVQFGGKNVSETYKWLTAPETETGIAGWYLAKDQDGTELKNEREIEAGEAFCFDAQDEGAGIEIPDPLKLGE